MFFDELEKFSGKYAIIDDKGDRMSYSDLADLSDKICEKTVSRQLGFILCKNETEALCGYLGFLRKGIIPVMLDSKIEEKLLDSLMEKYLPSYIFCPKEKAKDFASEICLWNGRRFCLLKVLEEDSIQRKDLALLLTTSGSTGSPKLVRQSYRNIQSNAEAIASYLQLDEKERPIVTLPMNYTYGLSILHSHLLVGATILLTEHPVNNKYFWDFFQKEGATSFGGVPYTYEMLKRIHFLKMDLPTLKTMTQAGGKLSPDLQKEFADYALERKIQFVVMYGQTEATARMAYLPADRCGEKIGSIGVAIPGGHMEIVDGNGNPILEPYQSGELVYRGENVTLGYAEGRKDLDKEDSFGGVLHTGDVAQTDEEGFFYIVGRVKRFLKLFGSRINLDEVDLLIWQKFPNLECVTTGTDDKMISYVTDSESVDEVREFVLRITHVNPVAVEVRHIEYIPKNNAGKILYKELEEK